MIIFDLNDKDELVVQPTGSRNQFFKALDYIKSINGSSYNPDIKEWTIPKNMSNIKRIQNKFMTGSNYDIYELSGTKAPYVKTSADIFLKEIDGNIKKFMRDKEINSLNLTLKDFQKLGVSTAIHFLEKENGFLIADDMGLGKTIQALAVINSLKKRGKIKKVLVSCPKNVKLQWGHEIEKFSDLTFTVIDGYNRDKRFECYDEDSDIYIINHDLLISDDDFEMIKKKIKPDLVVADEIHYFKSHGALRTKAIKKLKPRYRLGLTGTPMQNKPVDVHSIFEFLLPGYLGKITDFRKEYVLFDYTRGYPVSYRNLFDLKKIVGKRMIRRKSDDLDEELPTPHHRIHLVEQDIQQFRVHEEIEQMIDGAKLEADSIADSKMKKSQKEKEMEEISGKIMGLKNIQASAADDLRTLSMSEEVWIQKLVSIDSNYTSPKTKKLKSLVKAIVDYNDDFKVIIFSRFARMVNILEDELSQMPEVKKTAKIYGAFNENRRDEEIQKFLNDDECRIIIMSDAGAEGYNLQNASHLINFDEPWNPATLDQRNGRIRRIGSKWKDIFITNLITRNSVDIQIHETITKKRKYFDKIVENTDSQTKALKEFLKKVI